ncbi:potassium transporter Kup [Arachidicoccus terrestris]|uniref:potassium transporter Kup n=1 Tax=Arachidicoccus terrestris TaxID=2875539 RepID=UPI001CC70A06|nr:potassium transporter Kup [Arachidicoccus terrestris]UAY55386.1 potassium transporter Kup [Arachidicoccus terrestris]
MINNDSNTIRKRLLKISLASLGIVFGDIGTSPLYALRECFYGEHGMYVSNENIYGVLSLIFWSLIVIISIKYLILILRADNEGEGGIVALMELVLPAKKKRTYLFLLVIGLFGAALLYGDGMITPAISVLSAMEGLEVATPLFKPYIIPATILILFILFCFQKRGTAGVGMIFGPIILLWFLTLAILGLNSIFKHPTILHALNPVYAIDLFRINGLAGLKVLSAVFLVVTGGEALYADMGHFGKKPIRISWFFVVLPCLVLNYFGQGALLVEHHQFAVNPFYHLAPKWMLYPLVVLATMATVIASQAVISGAFSLTYQAIQLGFLPRFQVVHTSASEKGQIYIPQLNWMLFIAIVALVVFFRTSGNLAAAYGVAVSTTMVITTIMAYVAMTKLWKWKRPLAIVITVFFLSIDSLFFFSNIIKIPFGGWLPLIVAGAIFYIMLTWYKGRRMMNIQLKKVTDAIPKFIQYYKRKAEHIVSGTAIYMSSNPKNIPPTLVFNLQHNKILHAHIVLLTVEHLTIPYAGAINNYEVQRIDDAMIQVKIRFGYMDAPDVPRVLKRINYPGFVLDEHATYFLGKESVVITKTTGMHPLREMLYEFLIRNSVRATRYFNLPNDRVFEIGSQIRL